MHIIFPSICGDFEKIYARNLGILIDEVNPMQLAKEKITSSYDEENNFLEIRLPHTSLDIVILIYIFKDKNVMIGFDDSSAHWHFDISDDESNEHLDDSLNFLICLLSDKFKEIRVSIGKYKYKSTVYKLTPKMEFIAKTINILPLTSIFKKRDKKIINFSFK
jgi:hypothetical protein